MGWIFTGGKWVDDSTVDSNTKKGSGDSTSSGSSAPPNYDSSGDSMYGGNAQAPVPTTREYEGGEWIDKPVTPPEEKLSANIRPTTPGMPGTGLMPSPIPGGEYRKTYGEAAYGANTNNAGNYGNNFVSLQQYMKANQGTQQAGDTSGAGTVRDKQGQQGPQNGYNASMYGIDSSVNQAFGGTGLHPYVLGGNYTAGKPSQNSPGYDPATGGTPGGTSTAPTTGGGSASGPSGPSAQGAGSGVTDSGLFQNNVGGLAPNANFVSLQNRMRGTS